MARVRVGGVWLHSFTRVGGLRWKHGADAGCLEASWSTSRLPASLAEPVLKRGALVEIYEGARRVWLGRLSESGDDARSCQAKGLLADASRYMALAPSTLAPTDDVHDAITQANLDGWGVTYRGDTPTKDVGGTPKRGLPSEQPQRLDQAISAWATANGVRATVRADGVLRWETDPTTHTLVVTPGVGMLGRADDDYITHVVCRYISSVSGTPPVADGWSTVSAGDDLAASIYGRSTHYENLDSRGLLVASEAQSVADGILARAGVRLAFTGGATLTGLQLRDVGMQRLSLATLEAGRMVRFLGVRTPSKIGLQAFDVVIGSTDYADGSGQITVSPVGLAARNLADIISTVPVNRSRLNTNYGAGAVES